MHSTKLPSLRVVPPRTKHVPALEHKGKKAKNKIIPQAFYQASAFMAKSKGHVSPPASERGNYPFPVREQQMIANYGGAFCRSWILSVGRRRRFNFLAAAHLLLSFFPQWSFVACFFSIHTSLLRGSASFFFFFWASEGVFMCPALTYLFIVLHFLTVIFFFFLLWPFPRLYIVQVISLSASVFFTFQRKQWMEENYHNYSYNWAVFVASAASVALFFHQPKMVSLYGFFIFPDTGLCWGPGAWMRCRMNRANH